MDCSCMTSNTRLKNIIRNYNVVAEYHRCNHCGRIEWLWMTDEFELEMKNTPDHWFKTGADYGV